MSTIAFVLTIIDYKSNKKQPFIENSLKKISKFTIDYEATSTGKKTIYRINGKKVSKSKYIKTLSTLEKSCKKVRPDDYYIL